MEVDVSILRRAATYCGVVLLLRVVPPLVSDMVWREPKNSVISGLPPDGWNNIICVNSKLKYVDDIYPKATGPTLVPM